MAVGLIVLYNQCTQFNFFVKTCYALVYMPADEVENAWDNVVMGYLERYEEAEWYTENEKKIDAFTTYIELTWIGKKRASGSGRKSPLFPIPNWNKPYKRGLRY